MAESTHPQLPEVAPEALSKLKDRALTASAEGITIADARLPDRPLIYVNAGFERLTGYSRDEVIGRNCRFLQGAGTEADTVTELRNAIDAGREITVEILNYRKDGRPFWNRLAITPVRDDSGEVTHFIGIQSDVTKRRTAEDDLRKATRELESALGELKKDLDLAARIQRSLLPKASPDLDRLEAAWEFIPCAHLAGDFLNVFALDDRHAAFYVLDVSGHGASAALLSVSLSRQLSAVPEESTLFRLDDDSESGFRLARPAEVAVNLNERFRTAPEIAQYFTMVYGIFDVHARQLTYTSAGHPGPILVPATGDTEVHPSTGMPVGMLPDIEFSEKTLTLFPGDRLFLYTDGITEALNAKGEEFGRKRLLDALTSGREGTLRQTIQRVVSEVREWQGGEAGLDDLSLLGTEIS